MESKDKVRTPRQERSVKTKTAILKAAIRLFSEKGYHGTNTKEIAAEAGVSTGSFYSYFADKRAVFLDTLLLYNREFSERMERELSEIDLTIEDKKSVLPKLVDSLINSHQVYKNFHNEMMVLYHSDPAVKHLMDEQYERNRALTLRYLTFWKDTMVVKDLEAAAFVVFAAIDHVVDALVFSEVSIPAERIKQGLVDMVASYLLGMTTDGAEGESGRG